MASIEKIGNGPAHRVRWREGGAQGKQRQKTLPSLTEAKLYASQVTVDIAAGRYLNPDLARTTLTDYATRYMARRKALEPATVDRYQAALNNNILPLIGDIPVAQIKPADVDGLIEQMTDDGFAPATIRKAVTLLSTIYRRGAIRDGLATANPCDGAELPTVIKREMLYLTPAETERLAAQMDPDAGWFIRFLAYTGIRWGEARALTVDDIDLMRRRVRVNKTLNRRNEVAQTKTKKPRWVPLTGWLVAEFPELLERRQAGVFVTPTGNTVRGLLFVTPRGRPLHNSNFRRTHWSPAKEAAGLDPTLRIHDMRHTCATWLINHRGADAWRVMRWLGHTNINTTTATYSHLLPNTLEELAEGLDEIRHLPGDGPATITKAVSL
jgi:integrase